MEIKILHALEMAPFPAYTCRQCEFHDYRQNEDKRKNSSLEHKF